MFAESLLNLCLLNLCSPGPPIAKAKKSELLHKHKEAQKSEKAAKSRQKAASAHKWKHVQGAKYCAHNFMGLKQGGTGWKTDRNHSFVILRSNSLEPANCDADTWATVATREFSQTGVAVSLCG